MMLKTFSNKSFSPAWRLFGFSFRRRIGLLILACIGMLLLSPGWILLSSEGVELHATDYADHFRYLFEEVEILIVLICSIMAVVINFLNFSYLYTNRAGDVFHAVPLTRSEMFVTQFFSGYAFCAIPIVIGFGGLAGLTALPQQLSSYLPTVLWSLVYTLIIVFVMSALSTVFIVCAGSVVDAVLSMGGICGGVILVAVIIGSLCQSVLTGYVSGVETALMRYASPIAFCGYGFGNLLDESVKFGVENILFLIKAVGEGAILFFGSLLLYKYRKAESAGNSYAYRFVYDLTAVVVSFIGAFCLGSVFGNEPDSPLFWIFALIGAALTAVVYGVISFRGFKTLRNSLLLAGIALALLGMVAVLLSAGGFGFTARVPQDAEIQSATIRFCGIEYTESEDFSDILRLHENIVENQEDLNHTDAAGVTYIYFNYEMKNGATVSREFLLNNEIYADTLLRFYCSDTALHNITETTKNIGKATNDTVYIDVYGEFCDTENAAETDAAAVEGSGTVTAEQAVRLCAAYLANRQNATKDSIDGNVMTVHLSWSEPGDEMIYSPEHSVELHIESGYAEALGVLADIIPESGGTFDTVVCAAD